MTTTRKKQGRVYSDMIPFAYNFLLDTYGINGTPNIIISQYLNDCLARLEPFVDDDGNDSVRIVVSTRLINYYDFDEILSIVKHELVHYAMALLGRGFKDGDHDFESELKRLNLPSTQDIKLRGTVHIYSCNDGHDEIELHRTIKRTNVEDRICPKCKHPMKWKGTYLITKQGREKVL